MKRFSNPYIDPSALGGFGIELSDEKKAEVVALLAKALSGHPEILFSYAHGSFVELERFRDVDIAVYCDEDRDQHMDVLRFESRVASELEELIRLPVDVRVLNHAPLGFLYHVTCGRVVTSRDEELRCTFVERVWTEYLDYAPKAKEFFKEMFPPMVS